MKTNKEGIDTKIPANAHVEESSSGLDRLDVIIEGLSGTEIASSIAEENSIALGTLIDEVCMEIYSNYVSIDAKAIDNS